MDRQRGELWTTHRVPDVFFFFFFGGDSIGVFLGVVGVVVGGSGEKGGRERPLRSHHRHHLIAPPRGG